MTATTTEKSSLDPVTFEVLKNAFINSVDEMAEQILRTCYSFTFYNRDFSSGLHDAEGNIAAQGTEDCAVHVGTLHFTCKDVIKRFEGDIHEGDVFILNDPYIGGTHFCDVRLVRPIFAEGKLIAWSQSNGHWIDVGGGVPGSLDTGARDKYREGIHIPSTRIYDRGVFRADVANLIATNTRDPFTALGDINAQAEATKVAERTILRLVEKYSRDTVELGIAEVQDYVERSMRKRLADLPDGEWEVTEYIDKDPSDPGDKMLPIQIKMVKSGDQVSYDLTGTHPQIRGNYNCSFGGCYSGLVAGMKTFFPDLPLNSGFYRVIDANIPPGTIVSVTSPYPAQAYLMAFEKVMNAQFELWSQIVPDRAISCVFQIEFLLSGGKDIRYPDSPLFLLYDWLPGGWGGRNGKDGANMTSSAFGTGVLSQAVEAQERYAPFVNTEYEMQTDSAGPGKWRGGIGAVKSSYYTEVADVLFAFICDRERNVAWGSFGGLPATPMGITVKPDKDSESSEWLGVGFSGHPMESWNYFSRPTGGGGGFGDPLERDPQAVREDVIEDYVSIDRAKKDYGVVVRAIDAELCEYEVDLKETEDERARQRAIRDDRWQTDPKEVAEMYRRGEIDRLDVVRHYAVILDWGTGELLPNTTADFRELYRRRTAEHWAAP